MFAKLSTAIVLATAFIASGVAAKPIVGRIPTSRLAARGYTSFDNWGGYSSMSGFDNFYGADNFSGSISSVNVVQQSSELVCHSESVEIIQQRLLVLQEMAKRIITEQICEVETQTIVFEQFQSSFSSFGSDLRRHSGRQVGYDSSIASHYSDIIDSSDSSSLSTNDFGFSGHDLGSNYVVVGGSNWNDATSPSSVGSAYSAARDAIGSF